MEVFLKELAVAAGGMRPVAIATIVPVTNNVEHVKMCPNSQTMQDASFIYIIITASKVSSVQTPGNEAWMLDPNRATDEVWITTLSLSKGFEQRTKAKG